ncbi:MULTISPECIES: DUF6924 domain-containing protein [Streptomyces]|uniref:DUF6924 domain-containing protein n=1 Tax=Streptomyces siderophoricus TaxID=2802281 RepID=A0ABS1N096_9ACTN|nr:hypothetical protein [Streptomyces sp. 9-7]MBL1093375.1 hypothetical protein [Streptomyces sp. 9-7]
MAELPWKNHPGGDDAAGPVVRTDFSDEAEWRRLVEVLETPVSHHGGGSFED